MWLPTVIRQTGGSSPGAAPARARVVLVQEVVPHYRARLFEAMHLRLADEGIGLKVVYGNPNAEQAAKNDLVDLPPHVGLKVSNVWLTRRMLYQPVLAQLLRADVAILPNAAAYLPNWLLFLRGRRRLPRIGFLAYHTQQRVLDDSLKEAVSRRMMRRGDWWFAYTRGTRDYLLGQGADEERITVLDNSVDVAAFRADLESVGAEELQAFAHRHGIDAAAPVGLFCGGLHRSKRLEFLFESLRLVHQQRPDFQLIVVGDGSCRDVVVRAAAREPRIRHLGALFGREKAPCFLLSRLFLCPGLVGLGIQEAFAAGLPLLTTDIPIHSPEIDYLRPGINGLLTDDDPRAYAQAVTQLLGNEERLKSLGDAARDDARHYSVDGMAERFCQGIRSCLARP
jgi:glycosyltransferase involved in cell wall biosynthesis